ncbi:MAG: hypothetical protein O6848_11620 [Bacteroidetes bacterium]|nr:hypothetical protein [Bacteroidota bacterium]
MKIFGKLLTIMCLLTLSQKGFTQEEEKEGGEHILNKFKYAMVETLIYKDNQVDIHGISSMIRKRFINMGVMVVGENKESWPQDLSDNPCLAFSTSIQAATRMMGRQKCIISLYDCNGVNFYTNHGFGNAETFQESFDIAIRYAFKKDLDANPYKFDPELVTELKLREVEMVNENEESIKNYFDNHPIDPIEGIYEWKEDQNFDRIAIRKEDQQYKAIVLDSNLDNWAQGEVKGYFQKTTIPNVFNLKWSDNNKIESETISFLDEKGNLSIELKNSDQTKYKIDFQKIYPN